MAAEKLNVTMDANNFMDQAMKGIGSLLAGAAVDSAVIYNDTKEMVTFHAYNYTDGLYLVDAMRALVAPGHYGTVAASGTTFKIHPHNKREYEFVVAPGKAYVYKGPGAVQTVGK